MLVFEWVEYHNSNEEHSNLAKPHAFVYYSYHESLTRDIKMWPIAMDVFSYVGQDRFLN